MEQIRKDLEICRFDGNVISTVYRGGLPSLEKADLKWRNSDKETCKSLNMEEVHILKLSEIAKQLDGQLITVFIEEPLRGRILQYDNCAEIWYVIGTTCGYVL